MIKRGLTDPHDEMRPSFRRLAEASGVATTTITAMAYGDRRPGADTIAKVAAALRVDVRKVSEWVNIKRSEQRPYQPPPEADLLSREEQEILDQLIRALARSKILGVEGATLRPNDGETGYRKFPESPDPQRDDEYGVGSDVTAGGKK